MRAAAQAITRHGLLGLLTVLGSVAHAAAPHNTVDLADAIRVEPHAGEAVVLTTFDSVARQQSYVVYERIDYNTGTPAYRLTDLKSDMQAGYGLWGQSAHANATGFGVEVYPTPAARDAAYNDYITRGTFQASEISRGDVHLPGYEVYDIGAKKQFIQNYFYSFQTLVFDASCESYKYADGWANARVTVGYNDLCPLDRAIGDQAIVFNRMNGQSNNVDPDYRVLWKAIEGTNLLAKPAAGINTVLSPTIYRSNILSTIGSRKKFYVQFDCPMDTSVKGWDIIQGAGTIKTFHRLWTAVDRIDFEVLGKDVGPGTIAVKAYDVPNGVYEGARSENGLIPLDGDGVGPNRDSKLFAVYSNYRDNDPAADVSGFRAVSTGGGIEVGWLADAEAGTESYLVYSAPRLAGSWTLRRRVVARGAPEYREFFDAAADRAWGLWEVESDGDTLPLWRDEVRDEPMQNAPYVSLTDVEADTIRARLARSFKHVERPQTFSGWEYVIYAPRAWIGDARQHAMLWDPIVPATAVALEDIGGAPGIKAHFASIPSARYLLLMASAENDTSVEGRRFWSNDSMWANGFVRPSGHTPRPATNLIPMHYMVTPDSADVAQWWWTSFAGSDWWYIDLDGDGLPDPGKAVSRAPVSTSSEAAAFNQKTTYLMSLPPLNTAGVWQFAHDYLGNSGAYAKEIGDSLIASLGGTYLRFDRIVDEPAHPLTSQQRDQLAKAALDAGQSVTFVVGTVSRWDHAGGFLQIPNGFNPASLASNPYGLSYAVGPCGLGGTDYTYADNIGPGLIRRFAVDPPRGFWGGFVANRGAFQAGMALLLQRWASKVFVLSNQPAAAIAGAATVREIATEHPEYAELCMSMVCYGPTPGIVRYAAPTVGIEPRDLTLQLLPARPNPVTDGKVTLRFALPAPCHVTLFVYDVQGRRVATLVNGRLSGGTHSVAWSGAGATDGMYFVRLKAGDGKAIVRALVWLK